MNGFIYVLRDPETNRVRYVGWTVNISRRFNGHLQDNGKTHKSRWVATLKEKNLVPIIEVIQDVRNEDDWREVERKWIAYYRGVGENLVNGTDGGDGVLGARWKYTEEQCRSRSARMRGNKNGHGCKGHKKPPWTDEMRERIGWIMLGKRWKRKTPVTDRERENKSKALKGKPWSEKRRAAYKIWNPSEEIRKRIRDGRKGKGCHPWSAKRRAAYEKRYEQIQQSETL